MTCIKVSLLAFFKILPSTTAIEYYRRVIESELRPTFEEAEGDLKR